MKHRILCALFVGAALLSLSASNASRLDFSVKPKTSFSAEVPAARRGGFVPPASAAVKNRQDASLPDKRLIRSFVRLPKTNSFGDTLPDSLVFYRQQLGTTQKSAYDEVCKAVMGTERGLQLLTRVSTHDIGTVLEAVYCDNPECFWLAGECTWWHNSDGTVTQI